MNLKKYSLKTMCAALACTTVVSSMLAAYATDVIINETPMDDSVETETIETLADSSDSGWTTEENSFEDIKVTYQQSSSYAVTIPKTIALGTNKQAAYSVKVSGDIDANQRVYVAPVDGIADSENLDFYMKDLSGKKADVVATVTQNKTYWSSENVANAYEETNNSVSAPDLTAGTWEGTFQVEIRLETNMTQGGEESDTFETAPENAYTDWEYRLDEENGTIGLMGYKGTAKDVVVYDSYQIDGKTYKTKVLGAEAYRSGNQSIASSYYMFAGEPVETVVFGDNVDFTEMAETAYMFYDCQHLKSIGWGKNFDTSNVTNMNNMFSECHSLNGLDLSCFDTSKVEYMNGMFVGIRLEELDLSSFNTSCVVDMRQMFFGDTNLKTIYVGDGWDITLAEKQKYALSSTYSVAGTYQMFSSCGTSTVTYK